LAQFTRSYPKCVPQWTGSNCTCSSKGIPRSRLVITMGGRMVTMWHRSLYFALTGPFPLPFLMFQEPCTTAKLHLGGGRMISLVLCTNNKMRTEDKPFWYGRNPMMSESRSAVLFIPILSTRAK
jgi:hypothetical protein